MDEQTILKVDKLSKKFCRSLRRSMLYGSLDLARDVVGVMGDRTKLRPAEFWALDSVSLELKRGETLGILGRNGSGKSTILRLIAGIFPPDGGAIHVRGSVGALIALGAGFHPHMSGRENIFLNGTILGMSHQELLAKLDEIIAFSELGEFIDAPVSTYSSGMTVRLGFSIAVFAHPNLLIVDEVLAVGDLAFALKCYRKMEQFRSNGGSILLVSHSNQLIRNVCNRAIWLEHGIKKMEGSAHEVCDAYESATLRDLNNDLRGSRLDYDREAKILNAFCVDENGAPKNEFAVGEPLAVRIEIECLRPIKNPLISVSFEDAEAHSVAANFAHLDKQDIPSLAPGRHVVEYRIHSLGLRRGKYWCTLTLADDQINNVLSWHDKTFSFLIAEGPYSFGLYNPFPKWKLLLS